MTAILERNPATSDQIELRNSSQKPREAADITIVALSALDPSDAMNKCCKMKMKITGVISTENWWYMGCKECWKKLKKENGVYNCPTCTQRPSPRYRISFHGVDTDSTEEANPTFAEFNFFGQQGNVQIGKDADYLLAEARGRGEDRPQEILDLMGKKYIVGHPK